MKAMTTRFGESVAISGDMVIVGDPDRANQGPRSGIYLRALRNQWTRQQKLMPSDGSDKHFGGSVAISGNTVIVGADQDRLATTVDFLGSAYIFVSDGYDMDAAAQADGERWMRFSGTGLGVALLFWVTPRSSENL